jgi:aerobic-type carbon monoxide dehydrogenase small subunit (CoxS/CutS family)
MSQGMVNMENDLRIQNGITRRQPFHILMNGEQVVAYPGETIATALLAAGWHVFRHTAISGEPRGMFCGMGLCFDCMVTVNGHPNIRACVTVAQPGDIIERQI